MAAKTKIKRDVRGLYFRAGGYVFRPQANQHSSPHPLVIGMGEGGYYRNGMLTQFVEGEEVQARHLGGSTYGSVKREGREEYWHSHGMFEGKTADCWRD